MRDPTRRAAVAVAAVAGAAALAGLARDMRHYADIVRAEQPCAGFNLGDTSNVRCALFLNAAAAVYSGHGHVARSPCPSRR
jgi:hypothetical protein